MAGVMTFDEELTEKARNCLLELLSSKDEQVRLSAAQFALMRYEVFTNDDDEEDVPPELAANNKV